MEKDPLKIIIYQSNLSAIGGIETCIHNLCKRLSKLYDITLVVGSGDIDFLYRIAEFVDVQVLHKRKFEADIVVFASAWGSPPSGRFKAKKYIQMVHADYSVYLENWKFKYKKYPETNYHIAVSEQSKRGFEAVTPYKIDQVIYNLLDNNVKKHKKPPPGGVLKLITASRISKEKGFTRMVRFAELLKKNRIPFEWSVYGSNPNKNYLKQIKNSFSHIPEVSFKGQKPDVSYEISQADYLVQLSDTEGFAMVIIEALQQRTPCIVTAFPSAKEQITHGKNGYIVDFDLSDVEVSEIYARNLKLKTYKELSTEKDWEKAFELSNQ